MEKLAFTLIMAASKLKPYFQAHIIVVQTDKLLRKAMNNPEATKRLVLWAIKLDEFDILYRPRTVIKAQALANFVAKFTIKEDEDGGSTPWMIRTNGFSNQHVGGIGVVLHSPEVDLIECVVCLQFLTTNNKSEYEAVLTGLNLAKVAGASSVVIHSDSQFIVRHINGDYKAQGEWMKVYLSMVKERVSQKFLARFMQISRKENKQTNRLAKAVSAEHMVINS